MCLLRGTCSTPTSRQAIGFQPVRFIPGVSARKVVEAAIFGSSAHGATGEEGKVDHQR